MGANERFPNILIVDYWTPLSGYILYLPTYTIFMYLVLIVLSVYFQNSVYMYMISRNYVARREK